MKIIIRGTWIVYEQIIQAWLLFGSYYADLSKEIWFPKYNGKRQKSEKTQGSFWVTTQPQKLK